MAYCRRRIVPFVHGLPVAHEANMKTSAWKFELVLAATLFFAGVVLLPVAVYWVGQLVIGGYEDDAGLAGLLGAIWSELGDGRVAAWLLVSSPYVVVQLVRLARVLMRRSVKPVTVSAENR